MGTWQTLNSEYITNCSQIIDDDFFDDCSAFYFILLCNLTKYTPGDFSYMHAHFH
jgi:hypothetical protein